jgi:hypothetical protein
MLLNLKNEHLDDNSCRFFKAISINPLIINNSYPTENKKTSPVAREGFKYYE